MKKKHILLSGFCALSAAIPVAAVVSCSNTQNENLKSLNELKSRLQVNVANKDRLGSKVNLNDIVISTKSGSLDSNISITKKIEANDKNGTIKIVLTLKLENETITKVIELQGFKTETEVSPSPLKTDQQIVNELATRIAVNVADKSVLASAITKELVIVSATSGQLNSDVTLTKELVADDVKGELLVKLTLTKGTASLTKEIKLSGFKAKSQDQQIVNELATRVTVNVTDKTVLASAVAADLAIVSTTSGQLTTGVTITKELVADDTKGELLVKLSLSKGTATTTKEITIVGFKVKLTDQQIVNELATRVTVNIADKTVLASAITKELVVVSATSGQLTTGVTITKELVADDTKGELLVKLTLTKGTATTTKEIKLSGFKVPTPSTFTIAKTVNTTEGNKISSDDVVFRLNRMASEGKSFDEFVTYLKLFFDFEVNKKSGVTYSIDGSIAVAKPNILQFTIKSVEGTNVKNETFEVSGFIDAASYGGHSQGWNDVSSPFKIGDLVFSHGVTTKGEEETAETFTTLAKSKENTLKTDIERFNFIKQYITVTGSVDANSEWEYYIDLGSSHAHGIYSYHMYVGATHKLTGRTYPGRDRRGRPGFTVIGWNKRKTVGDIVFPIETNQLGQKTDIPTIVNELKNKTWDEQVVVLKKYIDANWSVYDQAIANNTSKYDYRVVISETGTRKTQSGRQTYENIHKLHLVIEYKEKTETVWRKKESQIDNFNVTATVGEYTIVTRPDRQIGLDSAEDFKAKYLTTPEEAPVHYPNLNFANESIWAYSDYTDLAKLKRNISSTLSDASDYIAALNTLKADQKLSAYVTEIEAMIAKITFDETRKNEIIAIGDKALATANAEYKPIKTDVMNAYLLTKKLALVQQLNVIKDIVTQLTADGTPHTNWDRLIANAEDVIQNAKSARSYSSMRDKLRYELSEFPDGDNVPIGFKALVKVLSDIGVRFIIDPALKDKYNYVIDYAKTKAHYSKYYEAAHDSNITFVIQVTSKTNPSDTKEVTFTLEKFPFS